MKDLKITAIEDDIDVIDFIKYALETLGVDFSFDTISNGSEFKSRFPFLESDLVVLDLMMPGITGFEICGYIRKNPKLVKTKVLAITGYDTPENKMKILNSGADDYLAKPFELRDLVSKLQTLISDIEK